MLCLSQESSGPKKEALNTVLQISSCLQGHVAWRALRLTENEKGLGLVESQSLAPVEGGGGGGWVTQTHYGR